jgi:hypothetical protein
VKRHNLHTNICFTKNLRVSVTLILHSGGDHLSGGFFCFPRCLHANAAKVDLAGHESFLQNPDSSLHHHTVSLQCTAFGNDTVVKQSVSKHLL